MTDDEIGPFVGKPVRVTLADGRIAAGTLHVDHESGHGHAHYTVVSDPLRAGEADARFVIHGGDQIVTIDDASGDPAARE